MERFWSHLKAHSLLWTNLLIAVIVLSSMRQPGWQYLLGGAGLAGLASFVSRVAREGFSIGKVVYALFVTLFAAAGMAVLMCFVLPMVQPVTAAAWDNVLIIAVAFLTLARISWVLKPHGHHVTMPAPVATAPDGWMAPNQAATDQAVQVVPAPAAAIEEPVYVPNRWRKAASAGITGAIFASWFIIANYSTLFYQWQLAESFQPKELPAMLGTVNDRRLNRDTAYAAIAGGGLDSNVRTAMPHLVPTGSCPVWQSQRYDTNPVASFFGSVEDVVRVKACSNKSELMPNSTPARFVYGDRLWMEGVLAARYPFSKRGETVYTQLQDGSWVMLISMTSTRPTIFGTMRPYLSKVAEVSQDGKVTDLTVEEAAEKYPGLPLYPFALMREYARAYGLFGGGWSKAGASSNTSVWARLYDSVAAGWNGWNDVLVYRKHINVIAEDQNNDPNANHGPYNMHTKKYGQQAMLALRPEGGELTSAWLYWNTVTGEAMRYAPPRTRLLWSPSVAMPESRKADPAMDRSHQHPDEPRPIVIDRPDGTFKLFYLVDIVNDDPTNPMAHSYVQSILVDADNKDAEKIGKDDLDAWEDRVTNGK